MKKTSSPFDGHAFDFKTDQPNFAPFSSLRSGDRWPDLEVCLHRTPPSTFGHEGLARHYLSLKTSEMPVHIAQKRDGRRFEALHLAGDLRINPARMPEELRWTGDCEVLTLEIEPAFVNRLALETWGDRFECVEVRPTFQTRDAVIEHLALALKSELESGPVSDNLCVDSLLTALAMRLLSNHSSLRASAREVGHQLSPKQLQNALDYIHDNLSCELRLQSIARQSFLSPHHFARLFKATLGIAPHQYVIQKRVEKAQVLLAKTDLSLAEIAEQVGFSDQAHLTRHFGRQIGVTPAIFRRKAARISKTAPIFSKK